MIATGKSNKEIARALCLSPATVKAHVAAVIAALGSANRTEAAFAARNFGVI
jgi:two-component system nitrate/nitrite response regulator NarL